MQGPPCTLLPLVLLSMPPLVHATISGMNGATPLCILELPCKWPEAPMPASRSQVPLGVGKVVAKWEDWGGNQAGKGLGRKREDLGGSSTCH